MAAVNGVKILDARRPLIERIAASRHVSRSARLRDLLLYLADRVLEDEAAEIHEQEVGRKVFGRPAGYDTATDNIVRVHASMLRKRLEQYFSAEGAGEPLILEIPKGNYALVFRERPETQPEAEPPSPEPSRVVEWRLWALAVLALLFACSTAYLLLRQSAGAVAQSTVRQFWAQVFQPGRTTDIVLDDAAVGLYQELTGKTVPLSNYFDRSYLRNLEEQTEASVVLRRHSSAASAGFLWRLFQVAGATQRLTPPRFARDYSFRELKANNAVLLGNSRNNPWVQAFEPNLGLRWVYDKASGVYYPMDTWDADKKYPPAASGDAHEGYFAISLVPNLGHAGTVLIVAGTGGSAINAGTDFLADEQAVSSLKRTLGTAKKDGFPYFEALIRVKGRSALPREATIVVCRPPRG
jgi:hypothetical protein